MASIVDSVRKTATENLGGVFHKAAPAHEQFSTEDVPDLTGKTAVITGASQGIGYAVAHTLLAHNIAQLHMISVSKENADKALEEMRSALGEERASRVHWHAADMADLRAVQKVGQEIADSLDRLDILVNNAGRGIMTYQIADSTGVDRHFTTNHAAHVVLTSTLLPLIKKTAEQGHTVRIGNQASNAHQMVDSVKVEFASKDELNQDLGPNGQYGRTKLANILYARYLNAHLTSQYPKILVNASHPGVVESTMSSQEIHEPYPIAGYIMSTLMKPLKKDQWDGAASMLYTVTKTENSGQYVCPPAAVEPGSEKSQDKQLGESLMKLTRELLCEYFGVSKWEDY